MSQTPWKITTTKRKAPHTEPADRKRPKPGGYEANVDARSEFASTRKLRQATLTQAQWNAKNVSKSEYNDSGAGSLETKVKPAISSRFRKSTSTLTQMDFFRLPWEDKENIDQGCLPNASPRLRTATKIRTFDGIGKPMILRSSSRQSIKERTRQNTSRKMRELIDENVPAESHNLYASVSSRCIEPPDSEGLQGHEKPSPSNRSRLTSSDQPFATSMVNALPQTPTKRRLVIPSSQSPESLPPPTSRKRRTTLIRSPVRQSLMERPVNTSLPICKSPSRLREIIEIPPSSSAEETQEISELSVQHADDLRTPTRRKRAFKPAQSADLAFEEPGTTPTQRTQNLLSRQRLNEMRPASEVDKFVGLPSATKKTPRLVERKSTVQDSQDDELGSPIRNDTQFEDLLGRMSSPITWIKPTAHLPSSSTVKFSLEGNQEPMLPPPPPTIPAMGIRKATPTTTLPTTRSSSRTRSSSSHLRSLTPKMTKPASVPHPSQVSTQEPTQGAFLLSVYPTVDFSDENIDVHVVKDSSSSVIKLSDIREYVADSQESDLEFDLDFDRPLELNPDNDSRDRGGDVAVSQRLQQPAGNDGNSQAQVDDIHNVQDIPQERVDLSLLAHKNHDSTEKDAIDDIDELLRSPLSEIEPLLSSSPLPAVQRKYPPLPGFDNETQSNFTQGGHVTAAYVHRMWDAGDLPSSFIPKPYKVKYQPTAGRNRAEKGKRDNDDSKP